MARELRSRANAYKERTTSPATTEPRLSIPRRAEITRVIIDLCSHYHGKKW